MIGRLRGTLAEKRPPCMLVDVAGVGYELQAPLSTFDAMPAEGKTVALLTHLLVREDALQLYGFATAEERALFRGLLKVSGVGAKLALAVLSGMSVRRFHQCIRDGDVSALIKLPGVGRKTAERLMLELRDRMRDWPAEGGGRAHAGAAEEAFEALVALGYKPNEAGRMLEGLEAQGKASEVLLREALRRAFR